MAVNQAVVEWLLAASEPWVRYNTFIDLLGEDRNMADVQSAYAELQRHPAVVALLDELLIWPQARKSKGAYDPKDSFWKLALLADFGLTADDARVAVLAENVLAAQGAPPQPAGFLHGGFDHTKSYDTRPYICISHVMTYALARFGYLSDPCLQAAYDYALDWQRPDGGWRPSEEQPSCPFGTVNVLRALGVHPTLRTSTAAERGVAFILACWERRGEPYRPVGFGMGSDFHKLQYPFVQHALLKTVDTLSLLPAALHDTRFEEMLTTLAAKAPPEGLYKAESAAKPYAAFDFGQKKLPSPWVTFLVTRAIHRRDMGLAALHFTGGHDA